MPSTLLCLTPRGSGSTSEMHTDLITSHTCPMAASGLVFCIHSPCLSAPSPHLSPLISSQNSSQDDPFRILSPLEASSGFFFSPFIKNVGRTLGHMGPWFPDQESNLHHPLHWMVES